MRNNGIIFRNVSCNLGVRWDRLNMALLEYSKAISRMVDRFDYFDNPPPAIELAYKEVTKAYFALKPIIFTWDHTDYNMNWSSIPS